MGQCCGYYTSSKYNKTMSRHSTNNNLEELNKNIKLINDVSIIQSSHGNDYDSDEENLESQIRVIKHQKKGSQQKCESQGESLSKMELSRNNSDFNSKSNFTNQKPERSVSRASKLSQSQGNCSENKTKRSFTSKRSMKTLKTFKTSKSVEHQTNNPKEQIKDILSYREVMEQLAQEAEKKKQYVIFVTNEKIIAEQEQKMKPNDEKLQYLVVGVERKQKSQSSQGNFLSISQVQEEKKRSIEIKQQQDFTSDPDCTIKTFMSFYNTVKERNDQNTLNKQNQSSTLDSSQNCTSGVGSGKNQQSLESQMESNLAAYKGFLTKNEFNQKELMQFGQIDSALQRIFFLLANQLKQRRQLNFEVRFYYDFNLLFQVE